jgi:M6 family metalloprotease-like protein
MFFVDFPDQTAGATDTPQTLYDVFLPAAAQWYANSSFGRLSLQVSADTARFYRMSGRADSYGWQRGLTSATHQKYIQDALDAYTRTSSKSLPAVDVLYIVPTTHASQISFSATYMSEVRTRPNTTASSGVHVARKATTFGVDAFSTWHFKTLNHETGHTMCLPDLYPLPSGPTGQYVGGWDLMGYINGPDPDFFAWHKWKLGWIDDAQIDCISGSGTSTHLLSPIEAPPLSGDASVKAAVIRQNSTAALVAEVRSRAKGDSGACATGVLVYQVSTALETGKGSIRVVDANPHSGGCAGDELDDAPLSLTGTRSINVPAWGVTINITGQVEDNYTITITVQ